MPVVEAVRLHGYQSQDLLSRWSRGEERKTTATAEA